MAKVSPNLTVSHIVKWCSGEACNWCVSLDIGLLFFSSNCACSLLHGRLLFQQVLPTAVVARPATQLPDAAQPAAAGQQLQQQQLQQQQLQQAFVLQQQQQQSSQQVNSIVT